MTQLAKEPERAANTALSLTISRVITGAPEDVFDAWTQPDIMAAWWGPNGMTATECTVDLRENGKWRARIGGTDGSEYVMCGQYVRIDQPRELVFTWAWEADGERGEETLVTVTFEPRGSNTALTLLHEKFTAPDIRDQHNQGWSSSLDCLQNHFA